MVTAVANALVVFLYWRLYFIDPALVNGGGEILWWNEYYLHLMGPVLQWIDFLFILGGARRILRPLAGLAVLVAGYSLWIELALQPLSIRPAGTVTSGLPYPFLNSMVLSERIAFYGSTAVTGAVFLLVFWGLGAGLRRLRAKGGAAPA
ncbi:FAR-17a/AIG1-like protein [Pseudoruegeria aquimaris]|uniref:FAR-17a/AIG1-like protein n=1 Tax=Pseudoruegeria aquimaris TaxID=393663 RepID=A0A1Y5TQW8_9RHOB|nr:androgen-induced gene 1 family protein [Pseudoruegeria aquimaris]SLN69811.1 FAR-17a/AIG1-like protein [Pseudoruegeria aquimaris]